MSRLKEATSSITHREPPLRSTEVPQQNHSTNEENNPTLDLYVSQFKAGQPRSLSGIAMRAFALGMALSTCLSLSLFLAYRGIPLWRAPFFLSTLCIFHFLEFWTTARVNHSKAEVSSFLLTSNGAAYNIAHCCALFEMIFTFFILPRSLLPELIKEALLIFGFILVIVGQTTRAVAILTAGPSFSHFIARHKQKSHVLVQHGIYSLLRHPSYFGFFWWGIGTQLICGNIICLIGYALVLFYFFKLRIKGEELILVEFFGDEYEDYARRTPVVIPGLD